MTPQQQATLRAEVHANPACAAALAVRDCHAIAAIMSEGRTRLQSRYIGNGAVLELMANGGEFMDYLTQIGAQNRDVYWSMDLLKAGRFDIGAAKAQAQLSLIAQAAPQFAEGIAVVKALGRAPDPLTAQDVAEALFNPDGTEK